MHPVFLKKAVHFWVVYHDRLKMHEDKLLHHVSVPIHTLPQYDLRVNEHHLVKEALEYVLLNLLLLLFQQH